LCLSWLALCALPVAQAAMQCAETADHKHVKATSFAPHATGHNHAYGAPIQQPILKHRPKPKPQLKSEPLPPA
jgi:hypothetical protein